MKKIIAIFLSMTLAGSSLVFADTTATTSQSETVLISLEKAYELAMENDIDVSLADDNIELAEDDLDDALDAEDDLEWSYSSVAEYLELVYIDKYYPIIYEHALENAKQDKEELLRNLKIEVTDTYVSYRQLEESLEESEANLSQVQTTYKNKSKEYELGLITSADLKAYEISVMQAELSVSQAENNLEQGKISFNQMVGNPIDTDFILTTVVDVNVELDYNILTLTDDIETYDKTLIALQQDIDEAQLKIDLIDDNLLEEESITLNGVTSYQYGNKSGYSDAKNTLEDLERDYEESLKDEIISLRITYNNLRSQDLTTKISKINYDSAVRTFKTTLLKHDLGLVTGFDLQDAMDAKTSAYQSYINNLKSLYISNLEFQETIGQYVIE